MYEVHTAGNSGEETPALPSLPSLLLCLVEGIKACSPMLW